MLNGHTEQGLTHAHDENKNMLKQRMMLLND